jgi:hypothetical protein
MKKKAGFPEEIGRFTQCETTGIGQIFCDKICAALGKSGATWWL